MVINSVAQFFYLLFTGNTDISSSGASELFPRLLVWLSAIFGGTSAEQLAEIKQIALDPVAWSGFFAYLLAFVMLIGILCAVFSLIRRCLSLGALK